jgi:sulfite reductase (ferredoxin)
MVQIDSVSKPEAIKQQSRQLRGHIARDLRDTGTPFDKEGYSLLKFHGIYQGYDRDSATERKQRGDDKIWQFMVRVRIPGGRLTAEQYLALDALAGGYADGSLRITTRQSIQFHGVVKAGLKSAIAEINKALVTTLAACGDVVRTVTTTPAPIRDPVHDRLEAETRRLSSHLLPRTRAYHEIWVDGAPWEPNEGQENAGASDEPDPLYGERYLPRKFKIGLAIPEDNTIDVLTNDLAIVALFEGDRLTGYNFLLGGGHGMTHNNPKTYPRLATPVAFVEPETGPANGSRNTSASRSNRAATCRLSSSLIISAGTTRVTESSTSAYRCRADASSAKSEPHCGRSSATSTAIRS